ncbi:MAG: peptidoglycan DD-metalloendopeptidase family protein [Methylococcaceae bacterium]|nr:peptidoglycan DD-metalloendopeptidase family protein [Methylococcaceae bacterium]
MSFHNSKLNFLVILVVLALLNACTTDTYYAPVKTDDNEFANDKQNLLISRQGLNKGNQIVTRDMRKYHVVKNRRTFHSKGLSSGYGYQRLALRNQKSLSYNITVAGKTKFSNPDTEAGLAFKKQQNTATKNTTIRQINPLTSVADKSNSEDRNAHEKQLIKLDDVKNKRRRQQKSIVSIDNKKMLELNFGWPIKGRVLKSFSPSRNKGIDIAGKKGQSVKASEAGKVVYGGQGLIGFGKLLIIKHNDDYLSAYANNSRLLVKEGENVQKGQLIAEVGDVGIKRTSLHFEIRKNGKPVNPLKLLPKK